MRGLLLRWKSVEIKLKNLDFVNARGYRLCTVSVVMSNSGERKIIKSAAGKFDIVPGPKYCGRVKALIVGMQAGLWWKNGAKGNCN